MIIKCVEKSGAAYSHSVRFILIRFLVMVAEIGVESFRQFEFVWNALKIN